MIYISLLSFVGLYILFWMFTTKNIVAKIPVAKDNEELMVFVRQLAQEARKEKRQYLTQNDRRQITSFSGKSNWSDLDVVTIFSEWSREIFKEE
jgi:hypothetical protein